jgi:hypothetical protein
MFIGNYLCHSRADMMNAKKQRNDVENFIVDQ